MESDQRASQQELFPDLVSHYQEGRDELNLAEFPISTVGDRANPGEKTIVFEDTTFDKSCNEVITRRLTITGSDKSGLPTAQDDEVLLGMLQLSYRQGFKSREVSFKPLELLKELGWSPTGPNYARLRKALQRWHDVSLHYENAWRDRATGEWVDADFHFIDNVEISKSGSKNILAPKGYSFFRWNEVVFRNFKAGNLKSLDFNIYHKLKSGVAKRMFRFLDKRFHMRSRLTFDLHVFAHEKIGITRGTSTDVAQVKRRLAEAISQLEGVRFIRPMPEELRFTKLKAGHWDIHFERFDEQEAAQPKLPLNLPPPDLNPLEARLVGHGVTLSQAQRLASEYEPGRIERQLDSLDFLIAQSRGVPSNYGGWLVKAITENYTVPKGFKTRAELDQEARERAAKVTERAAKQSLKQEAKTAAEQATQKRQQAETEKILAYLAALSVPERAKLEKEAVQRSSLARGRIGPTLRVAIIHNHVKDLLKERGDLGMS